MNSFDNRQQDNKKLQKKAQVALAALPARPLAGELQGRRFRRRPSGEFFGQILPVSPARRPHRLASNRLAPINLPIGLPLKLVNTLKRSLQLNDWIRLNIIPLSFSRLLLTITEITTPANPVKPSRPSNDCAAAHYKGGSRRRTSLTTRLARWALPAN